MPYNKIDPLKISVFPLKERKSHIKVDVMISVSSYLPDIGKLRKLIDQLAESIKKARHHKAAVILTYGAHVIKNGCAPLVNTLIENGHVTHVATQGAGIIHDWEFSYHGSTSECVRSNAPLGRFGVWDETGRFINMAVVCGAALGLGFGESMGKMIAEDGLEIPDLKILEKQIVEEPTHFLTAARADLLRFCKQFNIAAGWQIIEHPFKKYSVPGHAFNHHIPFTVHPGIGYDIYTNHPMFNGGAIGKTAETDARIFAKSVLDLNQGVYLSIGSAIMSPQVFEKAFSLANNIRCSQDLPFIKDHVIAINDIADGGSWDWNQGEPPKDHPAYYLRFCKSFYRMGGEINYYQCDNRAFLSTLCAALN